jgi:purine nucleosidase
VRLTREHARRLAASERPFAAFAGIYAESWIDRLVSLYPGDPEHADSAAMHDPLAVAVAAHPELATWRDVYVDVVTGDGVGRGVMVTDLLHSGNARPANCRIATGVDVDAFTARFMDAISSL